MNSSQGTNILCNYISTEIVIICLND